MPNKDFKKILEIHPGDVRQAKYLKEKSISYGVGLEVGPSQTERIYHPIWVSGTFEVGVAKPGKEVDRKSEAANLNDMWPYIKENEVYKAESASFKAVFKELQYMQNKSPRALELLGSLFVRSAFMLDHEMKDVVVMYSPPKLILEEIKKDVPALYSVPLEVFLQYVEMIAWNEEVKYDTKGKARGKPYGKGSGRENNLLTCAHLISVLLGRSEVVDFAYGFAMMRGVSPISMKKAKVCFPLLGEESDKVEEKAQKKKRSVIKKELLCRKIGK